MSLYQLSAAFTALASATFFLMAARVSRDRWIRSMQIVWAVVMLVAATGYLFLLFTELDAEVLAVSRMLTPVGWGALAIMAARMVVRRHE